jgi:two-component SAPR family response regulator
MAAINHRLTEQDLLEIKQALDAIEAKMYPNDPKNAAEGSRLATIGVFRNLIDPESVYRWITNKAAELFVIPVEKGHGTI